jgi:hypothetical protein
MCRKQDSWKNANDLRKEDISKIFGPVLEDNQWRIRTIVEREELYRDINTGTFINRQRLGWMGHLQRIDDARNTTKMYQANLHQNRHKGWPKARWKGDVENDIRKMEIVNWRQVAQDRDGWRGAIRGALSLRG